MRFNVLALTALLPVAGVLSGCAMGTQGTSAFSPTPAVKTMTGKAFGGQQAVSNGQIVVYEYGNGGYGSAGTAVATTTTDSDGNFNVDYTCSDPNAPVYVLSIGGQPGRGLPANAAIVLGAGIGSCAASENGYVTINEISTTVLAFALSHFFSTSSPDTYTPDHFGAPGSLTAAISRVNNVLIPTLTDVRNGFPTPSTSTFTNESAKIITIADVLGACVNSSGPDSPACTALFADTKPAGGAAPANTLEAAVNIALNPASNVGSLYSLVPPSGSSAFAGSLATQPSDWTIAVSYTTPTLGLGVTPKTITTLDIDTLGRVWFPSNLPGAVGVAYFDPGSSSFSGPFTAPGLVRPEQVAIDVNGQVWATDIDSPVVAGFPALNPAAPTVLSLPGTTSTALTINDDNTVRVAVVNTGTNEPSFASISNGVYSILPNTTPPGSQGYIGASLAGDTVGGTGVSGTDTLQPNVFDIYLNPAQSLNNVLFQPFADAGQIAFTGTDFLNAKGGFGPNQDALCSFAAQNCFTFADPTSRHPEGLAVDGGGNVWLSSLYLPDVEQVALVNGSLLNGNGQAANQGYEHGSSSGGTMIQPGGIGIDTTGNLWVSNMGCFDTDCVPGAFTLSEVIGVGVPTINPIAAQVVLNSSPGVRPSVKTATKTK